jgi:peptidoglycan/LPS O-acetylase OafA/YrhL
MWTHPITANMIIQHVLLYGNQIGQLDQVLWSLVQEMRISIIYPLIAILVLKLRTRHLLLIVAAIEVSLTALLIAAPQTNTDLQSFFSTAHFTTIFIFGAWLAKNHHQLGQRLMRLSRTTRISIAVLAFLAYSLGIKFLWGNQIRVRFLSPFELRYSHLWIAQPAFINFIVLAAGDWIAAFSAGVAILYALHQRQVRSALHVYPILITGRASYTLYLVHSLVLFALLFGLAGTPYFWAVIPGFILGTILFTWIFYRWVEVPTMNLGRRIAKAMQEKRRRTPAPSVAA